MNSNDALDAIGGLYAQVFDQTFETAAYKNFRQSIINHAAGKTVHEDLYNLSSKITELLVGAIDRSEAFDLQFDPEHIDQQVLIEVTVINEGTKSESALKKIVSHFNSAVYDDSIGKLQIRSSNIGLDARIIAYIALNSGLKVECKNLSLPIIEGDERFDISTNNTLIGNLDFASENAIEKWLVHLSDPDLDKISSFVIYTKREAETLQVKYLEKEKYFAILKTTDSNRELQRVRSLKTARLEIRKWFQDFHG